MESKNVCISNFKQITEAFPGPVIVCDKLYKLLSSVKEIKVVTNVMEVLSGLKQYICNKQLYDFENPSKISCKNDELSVIFGASEFSITDVAKFLPKVIFPVDASVSSSSSIDNKRKIEEMEDAIIKKSKSEVYLFMTSSDSADSSQDSESESGSAKDNIDTDFYLIDEASESDGNFSIVTVQETFDIEYEVESIDSASEDSGSLSSGSDSEIDDMQSKIISVICKSDSDMEFWADKSSDDEYLSFDAEISDSDKWECSTCGDLNDPPSSICLKCFQKRSEWFASENRARPKRKTRSKRKRAPPPSSFSKEDPSKTIQNENKIPGSSSSQESRTSEWVAENGHSDPKRQDSESNLCFLCFERPRTGTIIHANSKYAHNISCYECAKKLQRKKKRCPICRRSIQRVVCSISS